MITTMIHGVAVQLHTAPDVFSPDHIDKGTLAMLSQVKFTDEDKVLDLGCGYGVVGIVAAKIIGVEHVVMSDISENAISLSKKNAALNGVSGVSILLSDGFRNIHDNGFTMILSNPPYHTDFSTPKHFIEKGFNRLEIGGKMYMVTKRKDWYQKKLTAIFGGVKVSEIDEYFVFCAEKRTLNYANRK